LCVLWTICPGWLWTMILLISASQVARIIGMSHQQPSLSIPSTFFLRILHLCNSDYHLPALAQTLDSPLTPLSQSCSVCGENHLPRFLDVQVPPCPSQYCPLLTAHPLSAHWFLWQFAALRAEIFL
jgi:hypothetical protein